ncbi:assimilatory sulfite reductase (NADPH) flavoprotein subunit [Thiohalorhabdus methylotrophus]|uniref:Sulfite reductase [NADPH] flavoprotein alpha-component n=1 Tax=Thiohalorhabdus methylotrophus TaxID=3242694 RepID=A0ABV4TWG7_9GAMM
MQSTPLSEHSSPLTREQAEQLNRLKEDLAPEQATWISGYLAGLVGAGASATATPAPETGAGVATLPSLTVLVGSQTGNAQGVAQQAAERAREAGFEAEVKDMGSYKNKQLRSEDYLLVICSTHGEGEPPDNALDLHEFLHGRKAPKLEGTRFAVLSLGDRSYDHFCQTGKDFDGKLEELGGVRLAERTDCDVDFEADADAWIDRVLEALGQESGAAGTGAGNVVPLATEKKGTAESRYSRKHPFPATVLENQALTGRGSNKGTRHLELSLEGSDLTYEPGDSLGVFPVNRREAVTELLESLGLEAGEPVPTPKGEEVALEEALRRHYEIRLLAPPVVEAWAELAGSEALGALAAEDNRAALREYLHGRELIDLVRDYPVGGVSAGNFVGALRPLQARLYSIASGPSASPDEAHLTVGLVRYWSHGRDRYGVASNWLADVVEEGDELPVYVHRNPNFRLPEDPDAPIIMIGPGTGVAPFRAFLEEREETGAGGANWLFFGEQHFRTDFLYQLDWQRWRREGVLTRMDVAFSRDQAERVYVQDRLRERARELYQWLEEGAHVYVCGDAVGMAPAVHGAMEAVIREEGGHGPEEAAQYLKDLQKAGRYQRDVY